MNQLTAIAKKEFRSQFRSGTAYLFLLVFAGISGYFTWLSESNIFIENQARLDVFFSTALWLLFFTVPVLTMRTLAEEKRLGTLPLLLTRPISTYEIVIGKCVAFYLIGLLALLITLPFAITVIWIGDVDAGALIGGYLALVFVIECFIGISLAAGAATRNPVIAFLVSLLINFFFVLAAGQLYNHSTGTLREIMLQLDMQTHVAAFARGVFGLGSLLFFVMIVLTTVWVASILLDRKKKTNRLLVALLLFVGVNLLAPFVDVRYDATQDKRYSLCEASKKILLENTSKINISFFFTDQIHPNFDRVGKEFINLLQEYEHAAGNEFSYNVVYTRNADEQQRAIDEGLAPLLVNVKAKDNEQVQKAFLGAVVKVGDKKEIMQMIKPGTEMEYALSSAIKRASSPEVSSIALLAGHGETQPEQLADVLAGLASQHQVEVTEISADLPIPLSYKTLVIIDPRDTFPPLHLHRLSEYMAGGGNVFIAMSRCESNLNELFIDPLTTTGLETWLRTKGIHIQTDNIVDKSCGTVLVQQQEGDASYNTDLPFHYYPLFKKFANHTITAGLEEVLMTCPSSIQINTAGNTFRYEPLVFSSEQSGTLQVPQQIDVAKQWGPEEFSLAHIPVAVAVSPIKKMKGGRMVVIANGTLVNNGHNGMQQINPDNINLVVNAVDWLSDETGLIAIRTKAITKQPIIKMDDATRSRIKYLNMILPLLLVAGMYLIGFVKRETKKRISF